MTHITSNIQWEMLTAHPRLFITLEGLQSIIARTDTVTQQLLAVLRADAEHKLNAPAVAYPAEGFLLGAMRDVQGRILVLALMYRLSGDRRYYARARQDLMELAALPEWGTGHFLDAGEACLTAGIGLDWLYDDLSTEDRETLTRAIVNRALLPSLDVPEGPDSWMNGDFNWNQVCHAGLSIGALAVAELEPELAHCIVDRALTHMPTAAASYAPDGSYPEGPSYWAYGTTFQVFLIEALRSALGSACGLEASPGFLQTCEFRLQMVAPSGGDFNFSDYHHEHDNEPVMLWFAREHNRREIANAELQTLAARAAVLGTPAETNSRLPMSRHYPMELLWWNPEMPETHAELPLHWTAGGHLPVAVMRSAWNDPLASFLAIKGGTPHQSHGHMDSGSFVLECGGVRWALDLGTENYDKMRAARLDMWNYTQNSSRWTTFRVGPEGHNILRFNGAYQDVNGKGIIRALDDNHGSAGNELNLSSLYPTVKSVYRIARLYPDRSISIEDTWEAGDIAVSYTFQWLTLAAITAQPDGVRLDQAGQSVHLRIQSSDNWKIEIEDVSLPSKPQDSPNPGLRRLIIRQETAARVNGNFKITVQP